MPTDSHQQLQTIWTHRKWLVIFVLAVTALSYLLAKRQPPTYKADALVQIVSATAASGQVLPSDAQQSLVNTYLRIAQTTPVYQLAGAKMVPKVGSRTFSEHVTLNPESGSAVFDVTGLADSGGEAADYANAYANAFSQYVEQLQNRQRQSTVARIQQQIDSTAAQTNQTSSLAAAQIGDQVKALEAKLSDTVAAPADSAQVIGTASPPDNPSSPRPKLDAVLALIGSLVLAIAAILLYAALADRYRDADEAASDLGLSLLGELPKAPQQEQAAIESFRRLRAAIEFELANAGGARLTEGNGSTAGVGPPAGGQAMLVTAAERGAGKSYTTAGLSRTLASAGSHVVAIDGDLRRPTLHEQFGVRQVPGISDALEQGIEYFDRLAQLVPVQGGRQGGTLNAIAAGTPMSDASEQLSSSTMGSLMEHLRADCDYVVLDSSPILPVVDAVVLARYCNGVVFVVDARRTRRRDARRAVQTLRATGAQILGFVYNRTSAPIASYGYGDIPVASSRRGVREVLR
ncbi:MAG TPA: polysaccharide biosynthesis tyrosine autokinase [Solirubrobacteraceae bacterium]|nr:polysaccharide biosynthesis tyrosine autokinase [Solirubrobacteraceae bacterium]